MWPDFAKFRQLGKIWTIFGNFLMPYLLFGKKNLFLFSFQLGKSSSLYMAKYWTNNLAVGSYWSLMNIRRVCPQFAPKQKCLESKVSLIIAQQGRESNGRFPVPTIYETLMGQISSCELSPPYCPSGVPCFNDNANAETYHFDHVRGLLVVPIGSWLRGTGFYSR